LHVGRCLRDESVITGVVGAGIQGRGGRGVERPAGQGQADAGEGDACCLGGFDLEFGADEGGDADDPGG